MADSEVSPSKADLDVGSNVTFTCNSSTDPVWIKAKWETPKLGILHSHGSDLSLYSVRIQDKGLYFCYGYNSTAKKFFLAKAALNVYGKTL